MRVPPRLRNLFAECANLKRRNPPVPDVGTSFLVVAAIGAGSDHEALPLVERPGPPVRLEGPQLQTVGTLGLSQPHQLTADTTAQPRWMHVSTVEVLTVEEHHARQLVDALGTPRLALESDDGCETTAVQSGHGRYSAAASRRVRVSGTVR